MKRFFAFAGLVVISLLCLTAVYAQRSFSVGGDYKTDFNNMHLVQNGNKVTGTYEHQNGKIEGTLQGRHLVGTWTQSNGRGRFDFEFDENASSFKGRWTYNDETPTSSSGSWDGTKIQSNFRVASDYKTDFNNMHLVQNGINVTGTYEHQNGKIEGTLQGRHLVGTWTQSNGRGRFYFDFSEDASSFKGRWTYNDEIPTSSSGSWNGTMIEFSSQTASDPKKSALSVGGNYKTDFNNMRLVQEGDKVTGTYEHQNGKIEGTLQGRHMVGTWTQSNGRGRFYFDFSEDASSFKGRWTYNDETPSSSSGSWNGTKIESSSSQTISAPKKSTLSVGGNYKTDFNNMRLIQEGDKVTGTYEHQNGKIEGTLHGRHLIGIWIQSNGRGRFDFEFSEDASSFKGRWTYNDDTPTSSSGSWNGTKL